LRKRWERRHASIIVNQIARKGGKHPMGKKKIKSENERQKKIKNTRHLCLWLIVKGDGKNQKKIEQPSRPDGKTIGEKNVKTSSQLH